MPFQIKHPSHIENGATCHRQSDSGTHELKNFLLKTALQQISYILNISFPVNQICPDNLEYIENALYKIQKQILYTFPNDMRQKKEKTSCIAILVNILFYVAFAFKVTGIGCDIDCPGC